MFLFISISYHFDLWDSVRIPLPSVPLDKVPTTGVDKCQMRSLSTFPVTVLSVEQMAPRFCLEKQPAQGSTVMKFIFVWDCEWSGNINASIRTNSFHRRSMYSAKAQRLRDLRQECFASARSTESKS